MNHNNNNHQMDNPFLGTHTRSPPRDFNRPRIDVSSNEEASPEFSLESGSKSHKYKKNRFPGNMFNCVQNALSSQCMVLLVCLSLALNIAMFSVVLMNNHSHAADSTNAVTANQLNAGKVNIFDSPEYMSLMDENTKLTSQYNDLQESSRKQLNEWMQKYKQLQISNKCPLECPAVEIPKCPPVKECPVVEQVKCPPVATCPTLSCPTCPACSNAAADPLIALGGNCGCDLASRMPSDDLSSLSTRFDLEQHQIAWEYCAPPENQNETLSFCEEEPRNEQFYQLSFFNRPGAGHKVTPRKEKPKFPSCVQLPPVDYKWPAKRPELPVKAGQFGVNWHNLRVDTLKDLLVFNRGSPKNLYHFNASFYDLEQEAILNKVSKVIPFGPKVRLMLDVGAGGASLGLLLKRRYDVQTVATVFADWPYCEYITERGELCMYIDAMEPMPFAKFSYDVVHSSWVFHALFDNELRTAFLEQNRILRPGGYMWINGGWSNSQVETLNNLLVNNLGYKILWQSKKNVLSKTTFDTVHYELDWEAVLLKPIKASCKGKDRMNTN
jgi:GMP synthase-like glutamine amidotransferase